jgi:hypothetical protein
MRQDDPQPKRMRGAVQPTCRKVLCAQSAPGGSERRAGGGPRAHATPPPWPLCDHTSPRSRTRRPVRRHLTRKEGLAVRLGAWGFHDAFRLLTISCSSKAHLGRPRSRDRGTSAGGTANRHGDRTGSQPRGTFAPSQQGHAAARWEPRLSAKRRCARVHPRFRRLHPPHRSGNPHAHAPMGTICLATNGASPGP